MLFRARIGSQGSCLFNEDLVSIGSKHFQCLDRFIAETLEVLGTDANEILVEEARALRANPGPEEHALVNGFNEQMLKLFGQSQA